MNTFGLAFIKKASGKDPEASEGKQDQIPSSSTSPTRLVIADPPCEGWGLVKTNIPASAFREHRNFARKLKPKVNIALILLKRRCLQTCPAQRRWHAPIMVRHHMLTAQGNKLMIRLVDPAPKSSGFGMAGMPPTRPAASVG